MLYKKQRIRLLYLHDCTTLVKCASFVFCGAVARENTPPRRVTEDVVCFLGSVPSALPLRLPPRYQDNLGAVRRGAADCTAEGRLGGLGEYTRAYGMKNDNPKHTKLLSFRLFQQGLGHERPWLRQAGYASRYSTAKYVDVVVRLPCRAPTLFKSSTCTVSLSGNAAACMALR